MFGAEIKRRGVDRMRASKHWRWHVEEVFVKINCVKHYLWRAVDYEGEVLKCIVTKTRNRKAALRFLKKSMKRHGRPETIVMDRLRSYAAALNELGRGDDREMGRWLNNRAENSHLPFRQRKRAMLRFRRMRTLQKFASVYASRSYVPPSDLQLEFTSGFYQHTKSPSASGDKLSTACSRAEPA
jgi:putative transposase